MKVLARGQCIVSIGVNTDASTENLADKESGGRHMEGRVKRAAVLSRFVGQREIRNFALMLFLTCVNLLKKE